MDMSKARLLVAVIGMLIPFLCRIPRGWEWFQQYFDGGIFSVLMLSAFNALAWGAIILGSLAYRYAASIWPSAILGFLFLIHAHSGLDLFADAQNGVALVFIPMFAMLPIGIGWLIGLVIDLALRRRANRST